MTTAKKCCVLILVAMTAAFVFRVAGLGDRPMHTDEAVHADKFASLLGDGHYEYDPDEYHGPTLNYMTLIPALLGRVGSYSDVTEFTLRIIPVFFGVLTIALLLGVADGLGAVAAVFAAIFTAVSPAMFFYSRYYIQETLLVFFTFGVIVCGWRYLQSRSVVWAILAGLCWGLMHATKETCIIAYGSIVLAVIVTSLVDRKCQRHITVPGSLSAGLPSALPAGSRKISPLHIVLFVAAAVVVSVLFFSSFFSNWHGVVDSIRTYTTYFGRAGENPVHNNSWYFYLKLLGWYRFADGPVFTEAMILLLAVVGFVLVMMGRGPGRSDRRLLWFIGFYTFLMTAIYSAISYKTPWCLLGFYHGMILLAAVGAAFLLRTGPKPLRGVFAVLITAGVIHLAVQAYAAGFKYDSDSRNPWVYAHTSDNVFSMVRYVENVAAADPAGYDMHIQVIVPGKDYWPLPWYLRKFSRVGYWTMVHNEAASAPLIIASPQVHDALMKKLYEYPPPGQRYMYLPLFDLELRPQVSLRGYVSRKAWDRYYCSDADQVNSLVEKSKKRKSAELDKQNTSDEKQ